MAELKNDATVMVISLKQWYILQDILTGGKPRGKPVRDLAQAGIIDRYGVTAPASAILNGFLLTESHMEINLLNTEGANRLDLWISKKTVTVQKFFSINECHIYTLKPPEAATAVLDFINLSPKTQYSEDVLEVPGAVFDAAEGGDTAQAKEIFRQTAAQAPPSALAQAILDDKWFITSLVRYTLSNGTEGENAAAETAQEEIAEMGVFLVVPHCLYSLSAKPSSDDKYQLTVVAPTALWLGISDWFYV